ncbi:class I SAM-dependent methyltransferase [Kribbella sp. NPDC049174]|uniref:class I SAM-dependent methyltransferase n=1 Tax=Kribbella sp. NPDC049174 TaxID=3364112 RepID=UPI0037197700
MTTDGRAQRESDLISYYTNEVRDRQDRELPDSRVRVRAAYLRHLAAEGRRSVVEIGCGPGRDGEAFAEAGFAYTGVDLAPASVEACRSLGLNAQVGSVLELPFEDATFEAGWTMSTLLHVADADLDQALAEIVRVLRPGAPVGIGLWGDEVGGERVWQDESGFGPGRFFSIRTDSVMQEALARHGTVEQWLSWRDGDGPMHYQWAVLRTPA